jgi:hypothetical protein
VFVAALLLLIVAALLIIAALFGGSSDATLDLGSFNLETSAMVVFFLGMGTLLLIVLALGMFRAGARRAAARRADRKRVSELSEKLDEYKKDEREAGPHRDQP